MLRDLTEVDRYPLAIPHDVVPIVRYLREIPRDVLEIARYLLEIPRPLHTSPVAVGFRRDQASARSG